MTEAYIYDSIRTPRGKGRKDGALHEVTAVRLSAETLNTLKSRNNLDTKQVEDVVWGNVTAGDAYVAGGVEMMGRVPMGSDGAAIAVDPHLAMKTYFVPQGISADIIATEYGFSRDDVDTYAVESQKRAKAAWDDNRQFVRYRGRGGSAPDRF